MRKWVWGVLVVLAVVAFALAAAVRSPRAWEMVLSRYFSGGDIKIKTLHIVSVHGTKDGGLVWRDIKANLEIKKTEYFCSFDSIRVAHVFSFLSGRAYLEAMVSGGDMVLKGLHVSAIDGHAWGNFSGWTWRAIKAEARGRVFDGQIRTQITVDNIPPLAYIINVQWAEMALDRLAEMNQAVFGQAQGIIQGRAVIQGTTKHLDRFQAYMDAPAGGEIKASLLGHLAQYIPQHTQLQDLIRRNENVPLDTASVELHNVNDETLASRVKLSSSKVSLNMDVNMDVNVEGGILLLWQRFNEIKSGNQR